MPATILDHIGNTPLVELTRFETGCCRLFLKMECQNPTGSVKDRVGLAMADRAVQRGEIDPHSATPPTLVEATTGNTGIALAFVAKARNWRVKIVAAEKTSMEKRRMLTAMGAEVTVVPTGTPGTARHYRAIAQQLADETPNAVFVDQFANPANAEAHARTTGPEIDRQLRAIVGNSDPSPRCFVCGVGSGGTLAGAGGYLLQQNPLWNVAIADPKGSVIAAASRNEPLNRSAPWRVEGVGSEFVPATCDPTIADEAFTIADAESFATARALADREGVDAGPSTGCLLASALRWARSQTAPAHVVTLACDTGERYRSTLYAQHRDIERTTVQ